MCARFALPWEDADPTHPAWDKAGSAQDNRAWDDAAAPGCPAQTIVEAAAVAIAWADGLTPPPPPPPENWVGIYCGHCRLPPPPSVIAADLEGPKEFFIGSDKDDASEEEDLPDIAPNPDALNPPQGVMWDQICFPATTPTTEC